MLSFVDSVETRRETTMEYDSSGTVSVTGELSLF